MSETPREPEQQFIFARAFLAFKRLAQFDLSAVNLFDNTPQAAWNAQLILFASVPLLMFMAWTSGFENTYYGKEFGFTGLTFSLYMVLRIFITMYGFFLVVHQLGRKMGFNKYFPLYVNAQFSLSLPLLLLVAGLTYVVQLLGLDATTSPVAAYLVQVMFIAFQIMIDWMITYATLRLRPLVAFGISVMGVLFTRLIQMGMDLVVLFSQMSNQGLPSP